MTSALIVTTSRSRLARSFSCPGRVFKKPSCWLAAQLAARTQYAELNTVSIFFASSLKSPLGPCRMHSESIQRYCLPMARVALIPSWKVAGRSDTLMPILCRESVLVAEELRGSSGKVQKCGGGPHGCERAMNGETRPSMGMWTSLVSTNWTVGDPAEPTSIRREGREIWSLGSLPGAQVWASSQSASHCRMILKWVSEPESGSFGNPSCRGVTDFSSASCQRCVACPSFKATYLDLL